MRPSFKIIALILSLAISLSGCAQQPTNQQTAPASTPFSAHSGLNRCHQVNADDLDTRQCYKTDRQRDDFDRHNDNTEISLTGVFVYSIVQIVIEGLVHALLNH